MKQRLITGIVLVAVLVPVFIIGDIVLNITLGLLTLGATYEMFRLYNHKENKLPIGVLIGELILGGMLYFTIQSYYDGSITLEWVFMMIMFILVVGALNSVFVPEFDAKKYGEMLVSILYPAFGFGAIFALRSFDLLNIGFLFMITMMTDTFAYLVGVRFGKHRLAVHISPKKSWEGSIGGTFFATLLTLGYIYLFNMETVGAIELNILVSILVIVFISIMGQVGDLVASKLKRTYEIKDFSNLFPGHGGIMDRFDSVIFAGMVLMLLSKFVEIIG